MGRRFVRCLVCDGTGINPHLPVCFPAERCYACLGQGGVWVDTERSGTSIRIRRPDERE